MKKEIPPAAIVAVVVVLLLVIGFAAFKIFFKDPNYAPNSPEILKQNEQVRANSAINQHMAGQARGAHGGAQPAGGGN